MPAFRTNTTVFLGNIIETFLEETIEFISTVLTLQSLNRFDFRFTHL